MSRESYDALPYPAAPYGETHPSNLQTLATAFGLNPPPIQNCRVLELGCATGGNIVPMAAAWPDSALVGIDYSSKQIEAAQRFADAVNATNLSLRTMSISDITPEVGTFDYIIAHGIYSWVPPAVREKLLEVCRANLADNGVAYISFNTLPGGYMRLWLRDLVRMHIERADDEPPQELVERIVELLEVVCESPQVRGQPIEAALRRVMAGYQSSDTAFTLHDLGEEENHPQYLSEVVADARKHGLEYLGDAHSNSALAEASTSPRVRVLLESAGDDYVARQQTLDFLRNQTFRRATFVKAGQPIRRDNLHERVATLLATSLLTPTGPQEQFVTNDPVNFVDPAGNVRTVLRTPLTKIALIILRMSYPQPRRIDGLLDAAMLHPLIQRADGSQRSPEVRKVALMELTELWASRLIDLCVTAPPAAVFPPDKPEVWPVARQQLASGVRDVTNLRHEIVKLDETVRPVLPLLDGTRSIEQFVERAAEHQLDAAAARSLIDSLMFFALIRK